MALIEIQWNPTDRQLRQFGLASIVALPALTWLFSRQPLWAGVAGGVGVIAALIGWLTPRALCPVFLGASVLTAPIGIVVGELTLVLIYIGLFLPIGLMLRVLGKDPVQKGPDSAADTYWEPHRQEQDLSRYYRQS